MENVAQTMFNCIKYEICRQNEKIVLPEISARFLAAIYQLSKAHDVAHLVGDALNKSGVFENLPSDIDENERAAISKVKEKFDEQIFTAVYRYENINYELERLKETLEEAEIPFIPLKGSVIRKYYPEPWMRTSCDIDILVPQDYVERAIEALCLHDFAIELFEQHDVSIISQTNVHIELHFMLFDWDFQRGVILKNIWKSGELIAIGNQEYKMTTELFLLYHIYHTAKHFVRGGCGIKPFIDLLIFNQTQEYDEEKTLAMLKESGLDVFYNYAKELINIWFFGKRHNNVTEEMEQYIIQGGVYGSCEQNIAMAQSRKGGKLHNLLSRVFVSYNHLALNYPSLKKCPILFPVYQVRRWCRILFCGGRKAAMNEIKVNKNITKEEQERAKKLLEDLNL